MKFRFLITTGAAVAVLPACLDSPTTTEPVCNDVPFEQASVSGDTVTTSTSLRYIDTRIGTGVAVEQCREVLVHYTLYLTDGTKVDSSVERNEPFYFVPGVVVPRVGRPISGFEQGVIGMRVEGTRRLIVPPELGYGDEPQTNQADEVIIPANSTLIFDVELLAAEGTEVTN